MKSKYYIGIDQSLTNTAIVVLNSKGNVIKKEKWSPKLKDVARLEYFFDKIHNLIKKYKNNSVALYAMEGYSYSKYNMADLGELGGVIKLAFYTNNIDVKIYPPTVIKKFICGKGNAKKDLMIKEVYKKFNFDTDDDNMADAYGIARKLYNEETGK